MSVDTAAAPSSAALRGAEDYGRRTTAGGTRRRGALLEDAILAAVAAELIEVGYAGLTMEGVAARAHTGKASVYRRWPSKQQLVLDALSAQLPSGEHCPGGNTASLPQDTTTRDALVLAAVNATEMLSGPVGRIIASIAGQSSRDPELARLIAEEMVDPRCDGILEILQRGVARGEVRPEAVNRLIGGVGPALVLHQLYTLGVLPARQWIEDVVDQVLMPAIRPVGATP